MTVPGRSRAHPAAPWDAGAAAERAGNPEPVVVVSVVGGSPVLHEVVEAVEVEVGEELAGQVADGQPAAALEGGEEVELRIPVGK